MKKIISAVLVLIMIFSFSACGKKKEVLKIACSSTFMPYGYYENNELCGIDVDLGKALAKSLDMEYTISAVPYDLVLSGVESGEYDIAIAALVSSDSLSQKVNFTDIYISNVQSIITKSESRIQSISSLFTANDVAVGTVSGSSGNIYAIWGIEDAGFGTVRAYETADELIEAVESEECDCGILDEFLADRYASEHEDLKVLEQNYSREDYAIAIRKNDQEFYNKINTALASLNADGAINNIIGEYVQKIYKVDF